MPCPSSSTSPPSPATLLASASISTPSSATALRLLGCRLSRCFPWLNYFSMNSNRVSAEILFNISSASCGCFILMLLVLCLHLHWDFGSHGAGIWQATLHSTDSYVGSGMEPMVGVKILMFGLVVRKKSIMLLPIDLGKMVVQMRTEPHQLLLHQHSISCAWVSSTMFK